MSYEENILKQLLQSKLPQASEIEHHLFEKCNLNCSFCGQDHDSEVGMESIIEKAHQTVDFITKSDQTSHTVNVMGGEIFNDLIPESVFDDYVEFYNIIDNHCVETNQKVQINFVTNLIFQKNLPLVEKLFATLGDNARISTSYDFAGRGLDINKMMVFKKNLEHFKDKVGVVGFVLTRPSIRKMLLDKDRYFKEYLYPNFHLYFDWYVPEGSSDKMLPSEQQMLDALLYVADNYPNISPVKDLLENEENQMTCYSLNKTTILPDGKEVTCRYLQYEPEQFLTPIDYNTNAGIISSHLDRHDCFSCEYYKRCQFRCFVQADWATLERLDTCMFKTFFDKTIGNKEHVEN